MKEHRLAVSLAVCFLLLMLFPLNPASCQEYYEYNIQIQPDGSALWTITQFTAANTATDTWSGFQNKIYPLIDAAATATSRQMSIPEWSIQINTTISAESKTTEYSFKWQNCCKADGGTLTFGDVFAVDNFFGRLYGDAALELTYPMGFEVESVSQAPYLRQDDAHLLRWSRTQDLANNPVQVVFSPADADGNSWDLTVLVLLVGGLAAAISLSLGGLFFFRRRTASKSVVVEQPRAIESEEDKVLNLLKTRSGSMRQSEITETTRFSKAKTSQLLSGLERSGYITRYKKGRDKIVTLNERENQ
ncbi:MAG: helix-turn-helix domain-containing protein [Candidatus Bathyarchaeota archaeon]|nr:helix-turn-helix domain-containing protein [Candidatus Bathyarchaeota archaeon]